LYWGAEQLSGIEKIPIEEALIENSHNEDGSRYTMFGNDVSIGHLILVNDADARMSKPVIIKTVPEFLNDKSLGFTQHATKTLDDQRGESYYINMLSAYTDSLYNGHFLLSSILGCHPPLVGHSIILRSDAVRQVGRIRTLRKAQRWLKNIGLPFLSVDQIGSYNLQDDGSTEYWSENHVSEDFELMIHLYNLGFNGRYVCYPDCEFQEGITRTFDEEAGRHRKFSLGAHELMFNPFNNWVGQGIFSPLFRTFLKSDIPSYYKIFLTAYLFSYTSGGTYLLVFTMACVARILDKQEQVELFSSFSSAGVLALSVVIYYVIGYSTFLFTMMKMKWSNNNILFPEFRDRGYLYLIYRMLRYCMLFQVLFYTVMSNFFFLGSMDHLLARPGVVSATNKDSITIRRCTAFWDMAKFNTGSWGISLFILCLSYAVWLSQVDWDYTAIPEGDNLTFLLVFLAPACLLSLMAFIIPVVLNPFILGWPFNPPLCRKRQERHEESHHQPNSKTVDLHTFMNGPDGKLDREIGRAQQKPDVELGSLATNDFGGAMTAANPRDFRGNSGRKANGGAARTSPLGSVPEERKDYLSKQRSARNRNGNAHRNFQLAMI
jgi:cellulose synthase/poly-beta-1,6-N-acetylglucosamine synthase-like glycosyltransferase